MNRFEKHQKIFIRFLAPVVAVREKDYKFGICGEQCKYCIFETKKGCSTLEDKIKYLEGAIKNKSRRRELIDLCSLVIATVPNKQKGYNELAKCVHARCTKCAFSKDPFRCCEDVKLKWLNKEVKD